MGITEQTTVLAELETMIKMTSQADQQALPKNELFHIALIKHYFKASEVTINRQNNTIDMTLLPEDENDKSCKVSLAVDFKELDSFLQSCIDKDITALRFYKHTIMYYHSTIQASA